jgi:hypothetical protein
MQSRSFFTFGPTFNIICDSLFVNEPKVFAAILPILTDHLISEAGDNFITESGDEFIIE